MDVYVVGKVSTDGDGPNQLTWQRRRLLQATHCAARHRVESPLTDGQAARGRIRH